MKVRLLLSFFGLVLASVPFSRESIVDESIYFAAEFLSLKKRHEQRGD